MLLPKRFILIDDHELMLLGIRLALQTYEPSGMLQGSDQEASHWYNPEENAASIKVMLLDISGLNREEEAQPVLPQSDKADMSVIIYSLNEVLNSFDHTLAEKGNVIIKRGAASKIFLLSLAARLFTGSTIGQPLSPANCIISTERKDRPALSRREKEVLDLMKRETGKTDTGSILNFSKQKVSIHRPQLQPKFDTQTTLGLIMESLGAGII